VFFPEVPVGFYLQLSHVGRQILHKALKPLAQKRGTGFGAAVTKRKLPGGKARIPSIRAAAKLVQATVRFIPGAHEESFMSPLSDAEEPDPPHANNGGTTVSVAAAATTTTTTTTTTRTVSKRSSSQAKAQKGVVIRASVVTTSPASPDGGGNGGGKGKGRIVLSDASPPGVGAAAGGITFKPQPLPAIAV